jgi:alkylhydroperoxidase family enzyme
MTVAFISPPVRIPWPMRAALGIVRRRAGADLLPARLLTWSPRAAMGAGALEAFAAEPAGRVDARMLKFVRLTVSFAVDCPFCIGQNSAGWDALLTADELAVTQGLAPLELASLSPHERLAIEHARRASQAPVEFPADWGAQLTAAFTEREIVVLAATIAQVNYWARLSQSLGAPAAG